jgi:hypothetical protein
MRFLHVAPATIDFRRRSRDAGLFPQLTRRLNAGLQLGAATAANSGLDVLPIMIKK